MRCSVYAKYIKNVLKRTVEDLVLFVLFRNALYYLVIGMVAISISPHLFISVTSQHIFCRASHPLLLSSPVRFDVLCVHFRPGSTKFMLCLSVW